MDQFVGGDVLRFAVFTVLVVIFAAWEVYFPRYHWQAPRRRWVHNVGLIVIGYLLLKFADVIASVAGVNVMPGSGFILQGLPAWLEVVISLVYLDLVIYWQHRLFHRVPLLWRLHGVHHSDRVMDVSTAVRFHPAEILLSWMIKLTVASSFGISLFSLILFEIILNGMAVFNHANIRMPARLELLLSLFLVTPSVHRIHHIREYGANSGNFGFSITLWDRMFGSFRQVDAPQAADFGIDNPQLPEKETLLDLVRQPLMHQTQE